MKEIEKFSIFNAVLLLVTIVLFIFGGSLINYLQIGTLATLTSKPPMYITFPPTFISVPSSTPTPPAIFEAIAENDLSCFFGEIYEVNLPRFQIVSVVGKNSTGDWILVRLEEFNDCWVETTLLNLQGDVNSLPVIFSSRPPTATSTLVDTLPTEPVGTSIPTIELRWKVLYFECNIRGDVNFVTIDLDISGGVPPYKSDPQLPIFTVPGESLSIKVNSNTIDGEPSKTINFTVPRSSDFKCSGTGSIPGPITPVVPPSIPARCDDGRDNDKDGKTDFPADPECSSPTDDNERK